MWSSILPLILFVALGIAILIIFEVRARKEREAKVPQTGESIMVPACKAPAFKASKSFKDAVK